jgi:hypothetical protein
MTHVLLLRSEANHAAGCTPARIARRQAVLVAALAQVVFTVVHLSSSITKIRAKRSTYPTIFFSKNVAYHNRTANDAVRTSQLDQLVLDVDGGRAIATGNNVSKVANMPGCGKKLAMPGCGKKLARRELNAHPGEIVGKRTDGPITLASEVDITPLSIFGGAVVLALGVEVGTRRKAAISHVTKRVDVESVLARCQARDSSRDMDRVAIGLEVNGALHLLALQHAHGVRHFSELQAKRQE